MTRPCADHIDTFDVAIDLTAGPVYRLAVETARTICAGCPVQLGCLERNRGQEGVIAGMTLAERMGKVDRGLRAGRRVLRREAQERVA